MYEIKCPKCGTDTNKWVNEREKIAPLPRNKNMQLEQRLKISELLNEGLPVKEIAEQIGYNEKSVYNELARGRREKHGTYDPYYSNEKYINRNRGGQSPYFLQHKKLAKVIADYLISGEGSVEDAVKDLSARGYDMPCIRTIYNSIDYGLIPGVTRETLRSNETSIFQEGNIIIPKWAREKLGWTTETRLTLEVVDDHSILIRKIGEERHFS